MSKIITSGSWALEFNLSNVSQTKRSKVNQFFKVRFQKALSRSFFHEGDLIFTLLFTEHLKVDKLLLPKVLMCHKVEPLQFLCIVFIIIIVIIFIIVIGIYFCKAEQPLQGMELEKKKKERWKAYKKTFKKEPK